MNISYRFRRPPKWAFLVLFLLFLIAMLTSCETIKYVPKVETKIEYRDRIERDTIAVHDSINIYQKADTIYVTRYRDVYREKTLIDTAFVCNTDTIYLTKEIEKKLTKWQQVKLEIGGWTMGALIMLILAVLVYVAIKIYKR